MTSEELAGKEEGDAPHGINSASLTIYLILNTMIGSGILNQPNVFMNSGIVGALVVYVIACFFIWLGGVLLIECAAITGKAEYCDIARHCFGQIGDKIVSVSISLGNFGALMSYITVVGGTSSSLLHSWGVSESGSNMYMLTCIVVVVFILPFCLRRHYGTNVHTDPDTHEIIPANRQPNYSFSCRSLVLCFGC